MAKLCACVLLPHFSGHPRIRVTINHIAQQTLSGDATLQTLVFLFYSILQFCLGLQVFLSLLLTYVNFSISKNFSISMLHALYVSRDCMFVHPLSYHLLRVRCSAILFFKTPWCHDQESICNNLLELPFIFQMVFLVKDYWAQNDKSHKKIDCAMLGEQVGYAILSYQSIKQTDISMNCVGHCTLK